MTKIPAVLTPQNEPKTVVRKIVSSYVTRLLLLLGLCGFIGIGLPLVWTAIWAPKPDLGIESDLRYECMPLRSVEPEKVSNSTCLKSPCKWDGESFKTGTEIACYYEVEYDTNLKADSYGSRLFGKMPRYQFLPNDPNERKKLIHEENSTVPESPDANTHILKLAVPPPFLDTKNANLSEGPIVNEYLSVTVEHYNENHLRVLIKPVDEDIKLWNRHFDYNYPTPNGNYSNATVTLHAKDGFRNDIFQLSVTRNSTRKSLFNSGLHTPFIFSKGYIEVSTMLVNDIVYGLGQSNSLTFRHNFSIPRTWNLFSQYPNPHLKENQTENVTTMWGSHPFYMGIDDPERGDAHGVLLLNSFPITVTSNARPSLTFKTFGGHLEFHFFLGPRPADVLRQLQSFIHKPFFPPYWALGFHACSSLCSIPSVSESLESQLTALDIPVESDCGTAIRRSDANEKANFETFKEIIHGRQRRYLSMEAPHRFQATKVAQWQHSLTSSPDLISYSGATYQCNDENKRTQNNVYYPDFWHSKTEQEYGDATEFHKFADGYLLDYNTPLNLNNFNGSLVCDSMADRLQWNKWTFGQLNEMGPCLDVTFSKGAFFDSLSKKEAAAYELAPYMALHNMYGYKQAQLVAKLWSQQSVNANKRPFVLSLSTFMGIGRFAGHLGAPIYSNWTSLKLSLKQTLDFSIFGVAMSGFPVGGFRGETPKDEVLRRWFQLASVQPFMISYTDFETEPRTKIRSVREMIRSNIQARYKLLPYFYTLFQRAHADGSLVIAPLFVEFPDDIEVYKVNEQFMIGPALLASPVVEESMTVVKAYFPEGRWYEYYSGHLTSKKEGAHLEISAVEQNINLHLRGGHVVANHFKTELTIDDTRKKHGFQVIAALNEHLNATGYLYLDDGESLTVKSYLNVTFTFTYTNITVVVHEGSAGSCAQLRPVLNTLLQNIKVYGIIEKPLHSLVTVFQGSKADSLVRRKDSAELKEPQVKFQNNFGVLSIEPNIDLCDKSGDRMFMLKWTYEQML